MTQSIRRTMTVMLGVVFLSATISAPASAHGKKKHGQTEQVQQRQQQQASSAGSPAQTAQSMPSGASAVQSPMGHMVDDMDMAMDQSEMSFLERLLAWLGRLHPLVVHFPIAFFPAALFTAVVGRRRPAFSAPVQFLVVAGGILAPIATALGWLAGMSADPEPILGYHRWLGVAIGVAGAGLGIWAWKRPWEDRGAGMILALTLMTIAIAVQGFLGAGITHGMDHMMF